MARVVVLVLAVAAAGCAQLFGIDETSSPPDAAPAPYASLQIDRISVGTMLVRAPEDLTGHTATFYVDDAAEPSGLRRIQGALVAVTKDQWNADIPEGTPASIEFTVPGDTPGYRRMYALPSRTLKTLNGAYEHPNPVEAPMGGTFATQLALPSGYVANELIRLYAVGPWVYHTYVATELPAPGVGATMIAATIPYTTTGFVSHVGTRPLPKLTAQDQIVALRYVGNDLTAAGIVPPFEQTGGADPVTATLTAVPHAPLDVKVDHVATAARLAGTSPPVTTLGMSWSVVAAPAWRLANNTGPVLNAAGLTSTDPIMITAQFGNPFESLGWTSLFTFASNRSRTYTVPAFNLPLTLYAGLNQLDDVTPGLVLDQAVGVPVLVSIDKTPLNADGLTITIDPTKAVELSVVADRPINLFYQWAIYEVEPNTAMPPALVYKAVYGVVATETTVKIPHDVFVAGKVYMVRAHCYQGGYPTFATGDLQNRDVPYAVGYLDAGVFTVKAP
ncbi:MAG TPA: hypothetical protein VIV11_05965 [Kofleriaceae bacterium]